MGAPKKLSALGERFTLAWDHLMYGVNMGEAAGSRSAKQQLNALRQLFGLCAVHGELGLGETEVTVSFGETFGSAPECFAIGYQPYAESSVAVQVKPGSATTTECVVLADSDAHQGIKVIVIIKPN